MGMGLLIAGFMIRQWEHIVYYPFMYPILIHFKNPAADLAEINSILWCVTILLIGFWDISVRSERG